MVRETECSSKAIRYKRMTREVRGRELGEGEGVLLPNLNGHKESQSNRGGKY